MNRAQIVAVIAVFAWCLVIGLFVVALAAVHSVLAFFAADPGPSLAAGAIGIVAILVIVLFLAGWVEKHIQPPVNPWSDGSE